jgi:hypothetical protein
MTGSLPMLWGIFSGARGRVGDLVIEPRVDDTEEETEVGVS